MTIWHIVTVIVAFATLGFAMALPDIAEDSELFRRQVADQACTNGPLTRGCWGEGYSIATDYHHKWPDTGRIREYWLYITNTTMAPDGFSRLVMAVNGSMPGPTIEADWGDTLRVHVTNQLEHNATSIHWHGLRQLNTCQMDGTNGITECPLAPGKTKTYTILCTQFGTSWYHSHYSSQYGDGVLGTIKINGPATANYDIDLGTYTVQDWYNRTAFLNTILSRDNGPPTANNGLINGTMISDYGGSYYKTTLQQGKKYRLRLINVSLDNHFKVHLDGHNMTVITADFIPIVPYTTDWVWLAIGQRHDVIITANQDVDNYWFRAEPQTDCGANDMAGDIKSIFSYSGAPDTDPTSSATEYTQGCEDPNSQLVPYVQVDVPSDGFVSQAQELNVSFSRSVASNGQNVVQWMLNATAIDVMWEQPTLKYVREGNTSYPSSLNLIELPKRNAWTFWIIQTVPGAAFTVPHPIHLHGHDFFVLGSGNGVFDSADAPSLTYTNPPRRDVAMLPGGNGPGYLIIAFLTDNPGAWLMHCHIAWHIGEGFGAQFLERPDEILSTLDFPSDWDRGCADFKAWYPTSPYQKDDSGL